MLKRITPLIFVVALVFSPVFLLAQAERQLSEIEVRNMRFDRVSDNWIMTTVEIRPGDNISPEAISRDYIDDVRLSLYLSFEVDRPDDDVNFAFYRSSVRMVSLESRKTYKIPFFLPGVIYDRDRLRPEPFAWVLEMEIGGTRLPLKESHFGGSIRTKEAYDSMLSNANSAGASNDGILVPIYLAPDYVRNAARIGSRDLPAFYRLDVEN